MNTYYVTFKIPKASLDEWMATTSPEERKQQSDELMKKWHAWVQAHQDAIVDMGSPLGKTKAVTKDGIKDSRNDLNYVMIIQAPSHEEAARLIAGNPQIQVIPTASADVMSVPSMAL